MKRSIINTKRLLLTVALLIITLVLLLAPVQASRPNVYTGKHQTAMASWTMVDGDLYTEVYISACLQHANLGIYIYQWGPGALPPIMANGEIPDTARDNGQCQPASGSRYSDGFVQ